MSDLISRSYQFDLSADSDEERGSVIVGRPIVYGSRTNIGGMFDEVIEHGALNNTDLTDVRFLVNHDTSKLPLARSRRNTENSTMHLTVDNEGLAIRVTLDTENNTEARNLYSAVKRGDVSGMSFMFSVDKEEWDNLNTDMPTRHIRAISNVVEVSAVTFPAYGATTIDVRDKSALDSARLALDNARSAVDTATAGLELEKAKNRNKFF